MVDDLKDRLRTAMDAAGIGATRLAEHLDVSYQAIKKLLDGKSRSMDAVNCSKAARFLGVDTDWLATGEGQRSRGVAPDLQPPLSGIEQQPSLAQESRPPSVADAVHLLSQIATGLSPVSRRVVGNLLSNLAADPGEAAEVAKTIEALAAAGLIHPTEATEPDDEAVKTSWHGTSGTQERFKVRASMEDYRHATPEEIQRRSQKGDK